MNREAISKQETTAAIPEKKVRLLTRGFVLLTLSYALACTAWQFLGTLLVSYGTEELGLTAVLVGSISGIIAMAGLCMRPITAVIVDKFNKKYLFAFSILMLGVSIFGFSMTTSFMGMYAFQIMRGIVWAILTVTGNVMVSETVDRKNLGIAMGIYMVAQVLANSFSATVALAILNATSFRITFRVGSAIAVGAMLLVLLIPYQGKGNKNASVLAEIKSIRFNNIISLPALPMAVMNFLYQMIQTAVGSYIVAFARTELSIANVGIFAAVSNTIMWFTRPIMGKIGDKFGAKWIFIPGSVGFAATCLVIANTTGLTGIVAAAIIYGVATGGCMPILQAVAVKSVPVEQKGAATATRCMGADVGLMAGNMMMPAIMTAFGDSYRMSYYVMAGVAVVALVFAIAYFTIYNKRHEGNQLDW